MSHKLLIQLFWNNNTECSLLICTYLICNQQKASSSMSNSYRSGSNIVPAILNSVSKTKNEEKSSLWEQASKKTIIPSQGIVHGAQAVSLLPGPTAHRQCRSSQDPKRRGEYLMSQQPKMRYSPACSSWPSPR